MDALDQVGGSPPSLWPTLMRRARHRRTHRHTTHYDDCGCKSRNYDKRIVKLAHQVEKLSWMVEYMDQCNIYDQGRCPDQLVTIEGAEAAWLAENQQ